MTTGLESLGCIGEIPGYATHMDEVVNKQTLDNTTYEEYGYDTLSRLNSIVVKNSSHTTLESQSMVYDPAGNMTSRTHNSVTTNFEYDWIDQLILETRGSTGTSGYYRADYEYDANGNRTKRTRTIGTGSAVVTNYTYDDADKLTQYVLGATTYSYTYDQAGRPTSVPVIGSSNRTLAWDYDSHLTTWSAPGGGSAVMTNVYNGAGTRISSAVAGGNTQVDLRAGVGQTAPLLKSDNSSLSDVNYVPGLAEKRGSTWTYQHNGIKNTDAQTNASQTVSATREYDAFGAVVSSTGSHAGPLGYGGKFGYQEDAVGYKLLGDRWYDPEAGRFLTRDRAHDGRNWYVYSDNNPLVRVDEAGKSWHNPMQIEVDPDFKGRVIAVGEPKNGAPQVAVEVLPGYSSHPGMDVDYVIIVYEDGRIEVFFLMGRGYTLGDDRVPEHAKIDSEGGITCPGVLIPGGILFDDAIDEASKQPVPKDRLPIRTPKKKSGVSGTAPKPAVNPNRGDPRRMP